MGVRTIWDLILKISMILCLATTAVQTTTKDRRYYCDGECDVTRPRCSCQSSCKVDKNCCTDYEESCNGGLSWKDTDCSSADEMKCPAGFSNPPPVVVLSIDGYRDVYLNRNLTPTISKIASCGVKTPYMRSAYPTKTFPNHYTIATGLYPESHGIVSNTIYDHERGEKFRPGRNASFSPHWWLGEPIWVSASNQGLKSATYFWPGGEINITRYPDYFLWYNQSVPLEERAYKLFDWLDMPGDQRPSIIMLYNHVVDSAGHKVGPFGAHLNESLVASDKMVEMIMNGLRDRNLDTCVNFIIASDHGMAPVDCTDNMVFLEDYGVNETELTVDAGAFVRIGKSMDKSLWPKFNAVNIMNKLKCMREETHWQAFLKYEYLPKRYHYANNKYIEDVHLVIDDEWWTGFRYDPDCDPGGHGYDNAYTDMRAFFTAHGPGFKRGYNRTTPFESIELYNLMADLLELTPAPTNGTVGSLYDMMTNPPDIVQESHGIPPKPCLVPTDSGVSEASECENCVGISISDANKSLNISDDQETLYQEANMPYGRPRIFREGSNYCLLTQKRYITAYDHTLNMPLMSSFVLDKSNIPTNWKKTSCFRKDIRAHGIGDTAPCYDSDKGGENLTWAFLFSPNLLDEQEKSDATVSSNIVPAYKSFAEIWDFMAQNLLKWARDYNGIAVDVGPIFDYNYDGHVDSDEVLRLKGKFVTIGDNSSIPIPTHYFISASRCRVQNAEKSIRDCVKSLDEIDVLSFIIPNYKEAPCHKDNVDLEAWVPEAILQHIARIKDIELLTGISFYTKLIAGGLSTQAEILRAVRKKLVLPESYESWPQEFLTQHERLPTATTTETTTTDGTKLVTTSSTILLYGSYVISMLLLR